MDNSTNDILEQLVNYLDGTCTPEEKEKVQKLITSDSKWQDAWQSLQQAREAVRLYGLHDKVAGIHTEMMQELQTPVRHLRPMRRTLRSMISVAAALLLIVGGFFIYKFYTLSSGKVLGEYFSPYELSTPRGESTSSSEIEKAYRAHDLNKVTILFKKSDSLSVQDRFLSAEAFYETGNLDSAIAQYNVILKNNSSDLFKDEAEFYLSMAYIANKDYDLALPLLREIRDNKSHTFHQKVDARLIREVKWLKWR